MTEYKLVAIDIDGTLLTNQKRILLETKNDIIDAHNKGIIICICTGRGYPAAKRYIDEINLNIPLILYNGSRIRMSNDESLILNKTIDVMVAKNVFDIINRNNGTCCFWREDVLYFNKYDEYTAYYEDLTSIKANIIGELTNELFDGINKFLWFDTLENLEYIKSNILSDVSGINYFNSQSHILEIVPTNINKGESLKFLANHYNIEMDQVIAIGDDENDISMIKVAGMGVAMGNAKSIVKEVADYITLTNEENGVGEVIKKFTL